MNITKNPIAIFEEGNSQNQSIIFVHGFPYDHLMWKKVVEKLSGSFHCVTYDIRGMGISDPGDGQYTIESMADDLLFVINKLNLDKPYLCGMSMGGYIALRAVEREEKLFRGLLLLDTKASSDPDEVKLKRAMGIKKINEEGVQKYSAEFVPGTFTKESIEWLGEDYIAVLGRSMNLDPVGVKGCLLAMAARTDTTAYLEVFTRNNNWYSDDVETAEIEKFKLETGLESVTTAEYILADNLLAKSLLRLFTRFESMDVWDVRWDNVIAAQINKYLNVNLTFLLVYEKAQSLRTQLKESLQLGITYSVF